MTREELKKKAKYNYEELKWTITEFVKRAITIGAWLIVIGCLVGLAFLLHQWMDWIWVAMIGMFIYADIEFYFNYRAHKRITEALFSHKKAIEALNKHTKVMELDLKSVMGDVKTLKLDSEEYGKKLKAIDTIIVNGDLEKYKSDQNFEKVKQGLQILRAEERAKQALKKEELKAKKQQAKLKG